MSNILDGHTSKCKKNQPIIVSEENRVKHIAHNVDRHGVRHFRLDGEVIACNNGKRCDYLLINDDKKNAYLIELKGSHIKDAVDQIEETDRILRSSLPGYTFFYRIVYRKSPTHNINSSKISRWKIKHRGEKNGIQVALCQESPYKENI